MAQGMNNLVARVPRRGETMTKQIREVALVLDSESLPQFRVGYSTIADRDQRDVANGVTTERHGAFLVVGWACELARSMLCLPMLRLLIKREGAKDFKMEIAVEIKL